jgi:hypothetical protein
MASDDRGDAVERSWKMADAMLRERERNGAVSGCEAVTLTAEEREAIEWCRDNITAMAHPSSAFACIHAATLRKLLERMK